MRPLLVNIGFQVLFHSPPGVLFTFPSRYYALSVTKMYLALGGGPPCFPPDCSCPAVLWVQARLLRISTTGLLPSLAGLSIPLPLCSSVLSACPQPHGACPVVWALPRSLAATWEIDLSFSSSGYLDVSVPRVPPRETMCSSHRDGSTTRRVPPFGYLRFNACLRLPVAFRSLPRPSSALGARASTLCSSSLDYLRSASAARP